MPSLKDTKRRIASVKSTQKITRAMKLVSSAKFARANASVVRAQPYSEMLKDMVADVATPEALEHKELVRQAPENKCLVVVITPDRGLCGGLNTNLLKKSTEFIERKKAEGVEVHLCLWGKRSYQIEKKGLGHVVEKKDRVLERCDFAKVLTLSAPVRDRFLRGEFQSVYVAHSEFKNVLTQTPKVEKLLPMTFDSSRKADANFLTEPGRDELLNTLLDKYLLNQFFRIFLSSVGSEHAARMTAMDSATNNADEVIRSLTLIYNRARQAAITKELIEITSGAEAL